jgi:2-polyprenyl-6-hydroxyphenyl methylase/3-demethylubiquinone-9 3-methyltransferase
MFEFGKNWQSFAAASLDEIKIRQARGAFYDLVGRHELPGKKFLDIGFGQGLALFFSREGGADVYGIDVDKDTVEALRLTARFFQPAPLPKIDVASILDDGFVRRELSSGGFHVVHSWGALHHTGQMYRALHNAAGLVKPGGLLAISIYNRHWTSPVWLSIKRLYNASPLFFKKFLIALLSPVIYAAKFCVTGKDPADVARGMDFHHNVIDWIGGYPYEYARPHDIVDFIEKRGFKLSKFKKPKVPTGCNEFVFRKHG